jgi:hypothetical protein
MARYKLSQPGQPFLVRAILSVYEFFASLKLAVILIFSLAVLLGLATFVEANYGTSAVGFLIYHTWFFSALLALLGLNIFCAASIRFPWKRHQTGFVVTHIGLLTLLFGSAMSDRGSINSQMLVYLGDSNHVAIDMDQAMINVADIPEHPEPLAVDFRPGPFNWSELAPYPWMRRIKSWVGLDDPAKTWAHPPQVVYDDGRTKIEVVDYFSRSEVWRTPYLGLKLYQPMIGVEIPIDLEFNPELRFASAKVGPMGEVMMWKSDDADALAAFKGCKPDRPVDHEGLVAFWHNGERFAATIRELQKLKDQGKRFPLDDQLSVELAGFAESADLHALLAHKGLTPRAPDANSDGVGPAAEIIVYDKSSGTETPYRIVRFAEMPSLPMGKHPAGFYAEFYHPSVRGRIDILIGPDDKLAYRAWQQKVAMVVAAGDLEIGKTVATWSMGGGENVMKMTAVRFVPQGAPTANGADSHEVVLPLPFDKGDHGESKRVQMRVTWTDSSGTVRHDTFWLGENFPEPWENARRRQVHQIDVGREKPILVACNVQQTEVGFALKLIDFDLEVDPGTKTAANYTSDVIQVDVRDEPEVRRLRERIDDASDAEKKQALRDHLAETVQKQTDAYLEPLQGKPPAEQRKLAAGKEALADYVITMNRPLDYPDPTGRQLRFFQENYIAPDKANGMPLGSVFRVNYDPGRPVKYLGSGLIVCGIFLMFYMRAYFFKRPAKGAV